MTQQPAGQDEQTQKLTKLMKDIHVGMLTTVDEGGQFVSRPMGQQHVEFDGDLWFFSERDSRKVRHLAGNPHVALTLSSGDTWISINGTAQVVEDRAKAAELWNAYVEAWLPQGYEDPSVVLIKVNADSAEYWDTPGGRVASVISFAKAKITGERYSGGENERLDL